MATQITATHIRRQFQPGQVVTVTNHYITKTDHPCFGTHQRTIARVSSSHLTFTESGSVEWPAASQMQMDGKRVWLFGGGIGQQPMDLFLTIELP